MALFGCIHSAFSDQHFANKGIVENEVEKGQINFAFNDFNSLTPATAKTNAFPYKLIVLALKEYHSAAYHEDLNEVELWQKYGLLMNVEIANWQGKQQAKFEKPLGVISGQMKGFHPVKGAFTIEMANFSCASCHSGISYDEKGKFKRTAVLGSPNTSLNLDKLVKDVYQGLKLITGKDENEMNTALLKLFKNISSEEFKGINLIFNQIKNEIHSSKNVLDSATLYPLGAPGLLNGTGATRNTMGVYKKGTYHSEDATFASIPDLSSRNLRSSFLYPGNFGIANKSFFTEANRSNPALSDEERAEIISLFLLSTAGVQPKDCEKTKMEMLPVIKFLNAYKSPKFPGSINDEKAKKGFVLYKNNCQSCHGEYKGELHLLQLESFPNALIPYQSINSDSLRACGVSNDDVKFIKRKVLYGKIEVRNGKGYVAPILNGLWATAPYLHNGSVPTLWHLMHPAARPEKFKAGGHNLDFDKVGIKGELKQGVYTYDASWAEGEIYDTKVLGRTNTGHEEIFNALQEEEKQNLIEFLKLL
jgi:hypothetical protein